MERARRETTAPSLPFALAALSLTPARAARRKHGAAVATARSEDEDVVPLRGFPFPRGNAQCGCRWDMLRAQWVSNLTGLPLSPNRGSSDVCIVSIARGDDYQSSLGDALMQNKRAFCAACGYRCLLVNRTFATGRHPSWDKILAVQHALNSGACNLTMWVDADVVFLRSFTLEPLIRTAIAATREYGGLNGGVLFFRRSRAAEMLLRLAWKENRFEKPPGLEQSALRYVLGMQKELRNKVTMYDNLVRWVPHFYGGRVNIRVRRSGIPRHSFTLLVVPYSRKVTERRKCACDNIVCTSTQQIYHRDAAAGCKKICLSLASCRVAMCTSQSAKAENLLAKCEYLIAAFRAVHRYRPPRTKSAIKD
jgi:hypothetical protein